jgi:hypothetical protein
MLRHALSGALALACLAAPALAQNAAVRTEALNACQPLSLAKGPIVEHDGTWTPATPAQWQFLRGVYVVNPAMPLPGLPYGNSAAIAEIPGNRSALVFFLDGDKACTPMAIPRELVALLREIAEGKLNHEGEGL